MDLVSITEASPFHYLPWGLQDENMDIEKSWKDYGILAGHNFGV